MSRGGVVGVIGGYGETGSVVARELMETTDAEVVVAGRDAARAREAAERFGASATARAVDVYRRESVADLAERCDVIVNCAGPSCEVVDKVAMVCKEHGCHYVDPGGYEALEHSLKHHGDELRERGLTFISSAGFLPGLAEVVLLHADVEASSRMDSVTSAEVYAADRNPWSRIGFLDIVWWVTNSNEPGFFERGEWTQTNQMTSGRLFSFPDPIGRSVAVPYYKAELERFAAARRYERVAGYFGGLSLRTFAALARIRARMKRRPEQAAAEAERAFARDCDRMGRGSAVVAVIKGRAGGRPQELRVTLTEDRPERHYWITGVAPAAAARMLVDGRITAPGHHALCDAVEPAEFMADMEWRGVQCDVASDTA